MSTLSTKGRETVCREVGCRLHLTCTPANCCCRARFDLDRAVLGQAKSSAADSGPEWVKRGPRAAAHNTLLAAAVSDDGRYLAVGGGDKRVHVWDVRAHAYVQVGGRR